MSRQLSEIALRQSPERARVSALAFCLMLICSALCACEESELAERRSSAPKLNSSADTLGADEQAEGGFGVFEQEEGEDANLCSAVGTFSGYHETDNPDYGIRSFTLWAGKQNDAGVVTVTNDDGALSVTVDTNATADLLELQVYVWSAEAELPARRPPPGLAPY